MPSGGVSAVGVLDADAAAELPVRAAGSAAAGEEEPLVAAPWLDDGAAVS